MPNWCNNYITISGDKEKMKPIYDYFKKSQVDYEEHSEKVRVIHEKNPEAWKNIDMFIPPLDENLVMNTLVPHDEEYQRIKENGEFIINPQDNFYGTKWDFNFSEANLNQLDEDCITLAPSTAWSPPTAFCERLSKKYDVCVRVEFEEPGIGFVGVEEYDNGEITEQLIYENYLEGLYYLQNESFWENEVENTIEYCKEEEKTFDEMINENFSFITDKSVIDEIKELWEETEV